MEHLKQAVKGMSKESLELAFKDAIKRSKDGREIGNEPYAERQEEISRIIHDEIFERLIAE